MIYDFQKNSKEWLSLPVDDIGYIPADELLDMSDADFGRLIAQASDNRYNLKGYRNYKNKWREYLGLDSTKGKRVLDFGCGIGLEALQFHRDNTVILADINQASLDVSKRTLGANVETALITDVYPFFECQPIDIFYANGVLHHTPRFREILERAAEVLKPDGEVRLMLYSDKGWKIAGTDPVRFFDGVGEYADWYSLEKLTETVGDIYDVFFCEYITTDDRFLVAKLRRII